MAALQCTVASAEGVAFKGDVLSVVVPGVDGEIGILPRHAPMIAQLGSGELRISPSSGNTRRFFVEGGFLQVLRDRIGIVSMSVESIDGLTKTSADDRLQRILESRPPATATSEEHDRFAERVRVAKLRVRKAGG